MSSYKQICKNETITDKLVLVRLKLIFIFFGQYRLVLKRPKLHKEICL